MKYPTEAEIKKLKQKEASGHAGWRIGAMICLLLCLAVAALVMWTTQPAPLAYVPVTAIFPSRTDAPTPTLAATATASPTGTAVATGTVTTSSQLAQALVTYTPAPTYTPLPTYTPEPTQTAAPTQTLLPTYTPAATYTPVATYTPRPTPVIIVTYQTAVSDLTQARASLVWGLLSSFSLMLLSAAPLVYAWRHRPVAPVMVEGVPISETAVRLPPPTWQPIRERTVQRPELSSELVEPVELSSELLELPEPPREMALPLVGRGDTPPTAVQRAYIRRRFAETNNKTAVAMEVFNSKGGTVWFFINWALLEGQVRHLLGQEEARTILERGVS